ncbi:mitochondrial carrier domain-containing protein [Ochromonadaceae sp. CCMP2298]|nr:mitochondrial carrier domain-containing protein [Ochromonadaceae sp. CCMP2298]
MFIALLILLSTISLCSSYRPVTFSGQRGAPILILRATDGQKDPVEQKHALPFLKNINPVALLPIPLLLLGGLGLEQANADFLSDSENYLTREILSAELSLAEDASLVASYWRYFISGAISASFAHFVTVPFDVVKTRIQIDDSLRKLGPLGVAKSIIENEGAGALLTGVIPTVTGYFVQGSFKYGFYECFKPIVRTFFEGQQLEVENVFILMVAAAMAEIIASSFLTPFEAARIRLVADTSFASGVVDCVQKIVSQEGVGNLFLGLPAILFKNVPYTVMQLSIFELGTTQIYSMLSDSLTSAEALQYRFGVTFTAALAAAVVSSLASQPGDTLLSTVNKNCRGNSCPIDIDVEVQEAFEEVGVEGLFRGTQARLVHVCVIVVLQLLLYDTIKGWCDIPVTGFH